MPDLEMTEIHVNDWPSMVAWYVDTLRVPLVLTDEPNAFALLGNDRGRLAIKGGKPLEVKGLRLVFHVEDVDVERARLAALGVAVSSPSDSAREHYREVRLVDPEGRAITLFSWTGPPNVRKP